MPADIGRDREPKKSALPVAARELADGSVLLYTPDEGEDEDRDTEWLHSDTAVSLAGEGGC